MKEEPFRVNYISSRDCFLHLPNQYLQNVTNTCDKKCLKIQYGYQKFAFLSWCEQPYITEDNNCIGLNATYAQILGIKDQEEIFLSSYTKVTSVTKMYVSLLTQEEWEIMEANMTAVQSSLLDQIRVVWPGQILVVWVSKYLHFSLRVDSVEPNYKVGILEQYTDLAVVIPPSEEAQSESTTFNYGPKLPKPNNTNITSSTNNDSGMRNDSKTVNHHEAHQTNALNRPTSHEVWDTIKGLFSFDLPVDSDPPNYEVNTLQEIPSSNIALSKENVQKNICIPYRVHPLPRLEPKTELTRRSDILLNHPFGVFVHRCNVPKFACGKDQLICKLTKCMSSVNLKLNDKHLKHEKYDKNEGISSSVPAHDRPILDTVYVQLCVIEVVYDNMSFEMKEQFKVAAAYSEHQCILVSNTLYRCLHLKTGSRINLTFEPCKGKPLSSIKITPVGKRDVDEKTIKTAFQDYLSSLTTHSNLVLNSNIAIQLPINPKLHNEVLVQLLPQDLDFAILDAKTLRRCNIDVAESTSLRGVDTVVEKTEDIKDPHRPTTYFGSNLRTLISEGLITLEMSLCLKSFFHGPQHAKFHLISNMLILGKLGSGKTTLAHHLRREVEKPPYYVHSVIVQCKTLKGKKVETLHKMLMQWVTECICHQPAILLLDDVDAIAGACASEEHSAEEAYLFRIGDMLANTLEDAQHQNYIVVVATAPSVSKLSPSITAARGQHFFKTLLNIPDLSKSDRLETIKAIISQKTDLSPEDLLTLDLSSHAAKAEGYVIQDIADMVDKAVFEGWKRTYTEAKDLRKGMTLKAGDVALAMRNNVPLALRGVTLHKDSSHTWADVGGLMEVKRELIEVLQWPSQYMDLFAKCPLRHQSGLLLYGAPGTGKTLLAAAVSQECGLNFISVKGPELLSKYIGASEEAVRNIFQKAQSARPCVLFFDEFDSLAPRRGHDSTGVTDRVVNQLLTQLDGVESLTGVWVVAATSRPDLLDPALLRPGRLDKAILCSLPNTEDRLDILRALSRKLVLASDVNLEAIARSSVGFTGADLQAVLYTAQLMAVEEQQKLVPGHDLGPTVSSGGGTPATPRPTGDHVVVQVTQAHLLAALADTRPSLPPGEKLRYQTIYDAFVGARKGKSRNLEVVSQRATLA